MPSRARRLAHPVDRRRLISTRQPGFERHARARRGTSARSGVRRRSFAGATGGRDPRSTKTSRRPSSSHHDLVHRHRVEQLVGDEHAFERSGRSARDEMPGRSRRMSPSVRLRGPRRGAALRPDAAACARRTSGRVRRRPRRMSADEPAVAGAGFDEVERATAGGDSRTAAISAIWRSSSSPNSGPTSTLVKKSPARPERWAARA